MHWVIDHIISEGNALERLIIALNEAGSPCTLVKKPPFADYIVNADQSDAPLDLKIEGPVFVNGSTGMQSISERYGWSPGYIDAPDLEECLAHWGEHMLNDDLYAGPIGTIRPPETPFFIRPVGDGKAFAGTVMNPAEFDLWRNRLLSRDGYTTLAPETPVAIASLKDIHCEYRCLIVDGELITASRYKIGRRVSCHPGLPDETAAFVQARVKQWVPRRAFILDVAETDRGIRIVENNSVSSAGFYAMDMDRYVAAINRLAD